ncbi:MAG: hypothetical protein N4A33_09695 [Bacteriovoracaceae bacterium]|nr:hypothetical protein [Bacteriovoracaceae bacterium]
MKCFSLLLILMSFNCYPVEFLLSSTSQDVVTIGDIVRLEVTPQDEKILDYKNTRISPLLYVIDVEKNDDNYFVNAVISEQVKNEEIKVSDAFKVRGINFDSSKKVDLSGPMKLYLKKYQVTDTKAIILLSFLFVVLLSVFYKFIYPKVKEIRKKKIKQKKLELLLNRTSDREKFEAIYRAKKEFENNFTYEFKVFDEFFNHINEVQYKKNIMEETISELETLCNRFKKSMRRKRGV